MASLALTEGSDCFAEGKFEMFISAITEYLGFEIDCDQLLVTWPKRKCIELCDMIITLIHDSNANEICRPTSAPKLHCFHHWKIAIYYHCGTLGSLSGIPFHEAAAPVCSLLFSSRRVNQTLAVPQPGAHW